MKIHVLMESGDTWIVPSHCVVKKLSLKSGRKKKVVRVSTEENYGAKVKLSNFSTCSEKLRAKDDLIVLGTVPLDVTKGHPSLKKLRSMHSCNAKQIWLDSCYEKTVLFMLSVYA